MIAQYVFFFGHPSVVCLRIKQIIRTLSQSGKLGSDYIVLAPQVGLEPTTTRLTAECSAIELLRNMGKRSFDTPFSHGIRRRPTLPGRVQPSTIGAEGLNFCVRDGNRWNPFAITTGNLFQGLSYLDNCTVSFRTFAICSDLSQFPEIKPSTY